MSKALALALVVASSLFAPKASAFGADGHMTIGSIADALLQGSRAGKVARSILGTNLRTASIWADCARSVKTPAFKYEVNPVYRECEPYEQDPASLRLLEDFVRRNYRQCPVVPHNTDPCHKQYHYTNVSIEQSAYAPGLRGTSGHDLVQAISAMIVKLQVPLQSAPAPFDIKNRKEALRLLVHYLGDIHQPLHVASVYLDREGQPVDPDRTTPFDPQWRTFGANDLLVPSGTLHGAWDGLHGPFATEAPSDDTLKRARAVSLTPGPISGWSKQWADESLGLGKSAFDKLVYEPEVEGKHRVTLPAGYGERRVSVQHEQVIRAGARLAHLLRAIWPD